MGGGEGGGGARAFVLSWRFGACPSCFMVYLASVLRRGGWCVGREIDLNLMVGGGSLSWGRTGGRKGGRKGGREGGREGGGRGGGCWSVDDHETFGSCTCPAQRLPIATVKKRNPVECDT